MQRRSPHAVALALLLLLAGCIGGSGPSTAETVPPDTEQSPSQCSGGETMPNLDVPDRQLPERSEGFELSTNMTILDRGDPISFSLENVADERRHTGTKAKRILQYRTADRWETVTLLRESYLGFNATAIVHDPGDGFEWSFEANSAGFSQGKFVVCDRLRTGEYRFVYAGDPQVAVTFEVRD